MSLTGNQLTHINDLVDAQVFGNADDNYASVDIDNQPNNNYHRRNPTNSTQPHANPTGMELRLLTTFRDAGAVIGTFHSE